MAATSLTAVPGGLGVVETALILGLTTAGAPLTAAVAAVLVYRILSLGSVVVIGWGVLAVQRLRRHGVIGGSADQAESAHPAARTPPTSPAPPSTDAPFHPARDPLRPTGNTPRPAGAPFNMPGHGHGRGPRRDSPAVCPPSARTGCGSPAPPDPDTTPTGVTTTGAAAVHGHGAGSRPAWGV
ncbi:MAG TPA: YbhN family protein [Nakamurella sp.]|nr:YbhN family protein [Nakamurella sp.]